MIEGAVTQAARVPATMDETSPTADHSSVPKPTGSPQKTEPLAVEALAVGTVVRRWSHLRRACIEAAWDCWRRRRHIFAECRRLRNPIQRGDLWMLRFRYTRFNRWREYQDFQNFALPHVDSK